MSDSDPVSGYLPYRIECIICGTMVDCPEMAVDISPTRDIVVVYKIMPHNCTAHQPPIRPAIQKRRAEIVEREAS